MNYHVTKETLTCYLDGKVHVVSFQNESYQIILELIREGKIEEIHKVLNPAPAPVFLQEGVEVKNGSLVIEGEVISGKLAERLLWMIEEKLPLGPLVNFWKKMSGNPSYKTRQQLFEFIDRYKHPIIEDGCFIAYRKVTENFKDFHTGTMDNSVGKTVSMDRYLVDDDSDNVCSAGLHVAAYRYAEKFDPRGHMLAVKVDPKNVVSVPRDYDGQKMRVCKFEVLSVVEKELGKNPVYRN
jgi:hypothetical protein